MKYQRLGKETFIWKAKKTNYYWYDVATTLYFTKIRFSSYKIFRKSSCCVKGNRGFYFYFPGSFARSFLRKHVHILYLNLLQTEFCWVKNQNKKGFELFITIFSQESCRYASTF